jgi:hypothetical protein
MSGGAQTKQGLERHTASVIQCAAYLNGDLWFRNQ